MEMSRSRSADAGDDGAISRAQVLQHQSTASMWVVVDGTWVVNVTAFLPHHPGGLKIMSATIDANFSFKHGENAHFATTATAFDEVEILAAATLVVVRPAFENEQDRRVHVSHTAQAATRAKHRRKE